MLELPHPALAGEVDGAIVQPKDNNTKNNSEWFYGLTWIGLTLMAGRIGYAIGSEVNDDAVAAISGAVCGVTAGAVLAVYLYQPKGCLKVPYYVYTY